MQETSQANTDNPATQSLEYAEKPAWRHRRWTFRIALAASALLILAAIWRFGPVAGRHFEVLRLQSELFASPLVPDQSLKIPGTARPIGGFVWERYYAAASGNPVSTHYPIVLSRMQTPAGDERFVMIDCIELPYPTGNIVQLVPRVIQPATLFRSPRILTPYLLNPIPLPLDVTRSEVRTAQMDPRDPSHFTFDIVSQEDSSRRTYDGWLRDDDSVVIELRK